MNKKTVIQIILIFLIFLISLSFYLKYFSNNSKVLKDTPLEEKIAANQNNTSTYIDNIDYVSFDAKGNKYQVTAEQAEIKIENSDVMFLTNVIAYIFIKDSDTVKITSNFGEYNSKNYDTIFSENVIVIYPGHKITGEYLDFSFLKNLGTMSTNVVYNGEKTNLFADKLEMNLSTKDTKIFMNDASEKVLIQGTK
ncbi:MAG: LPS export ABC transporter periplasmic protein LptC [Pelagibacteraceae bacterium BACL20 MAG-120920-bin64]|jgi:LPS export ABC transporter protein LptC|nr:MAG: LPS export ABC transporter periplasmic protein LptC [Pelagibacteraceae bacterium BACL20 MAG-120920-bin64]